MKRAVLDQLRAGQFDLIALQEVNRNFEKSILRESWTMDFIVTSLNDSAREGVEGCLLLVRRELVGRGSLVEFVKLAGARNEIKGLIVLKLFEQGREKVREELFCCDLKVLLTI